MRLFVLFLCAGFSVFTQGLDTQPLPIDVSNLEKNTVIVRTLFFVESTITIPCESFNAGAGAEYIILETDIRHTSSNAVKTENNMGKYKYFFAVDDDIIIFDRRANTPIWYACAVGACVIAMTIYFLIARKNSSKSLDARPKPLHN